MTVQGDWADLRAAWADLWRGVWGVYRPGVHALTAGLADMLEWLPTVLLWLVLALLCWAALVLPVLWATGVL